MMEDGIGSIHMENQNLSEDEMFQIEESMVAIRECGNNELLDWYKHLEDHCNTRVKAEILISLRREIQSRGLEWEIRK
jgi:hypothetical protein